MVQQMILHIHLLLLRCLNHENFSSYDSSYDTQHMQFCISTVFWNSDVESNLTFCFPIFPFDPPENIRKPLVFCFQGGGRVKREREWISILTFGIHSSNHNIPVTSHVKTCLNPATMVHIKVLKFLKFNNQNIKIEW